MYRCCTKHYLKIRNGIFFRIVFEFKISYISIVLPKNSKSDSKKVTGFCEIAYLSYQKILFSIKKNVAVVFFSINIPDITFYLNLDAKFEVYWSRNAPSRGFNKNKVFSRLF